MIDRGAAFGSAAISVALAMLVAFLFFYTFYLRRYRSGSKGTAAKICLLLGAVSAFFFFEGALMILNELIHSRWAGISVREDKIYRGLLVSVPVVVVVSIITWIVGFFDSSGSCSSEISDSSSISPKPTVDQQIFKTDLIVYALIAASIILVVVVPNWEQFSNVIKSKQTPSAVPILKPSNQEQKVQPTATIKELNSVCYLYWDGLRWQRGKTEGANFKRFIISRYGVDIFEISLPTQMAQEFRIADKEAKEVDIYNGPFGAFMGEYWKQLDDICKSR